MVAFLKTDPLSLGALLTMRKLDLFAARGDIFDAIDPHATLMAPPPPADNDRAMAALRPGSLVSNATGLGEYAPGPPLSFDGGFPKAASSGN